MSHELEVVAGASAGGFVRRRAPPHLLPSGTPCANCGAPLQGPWCYACGQSAEDFHRSIVRLAGEMVEGFFHVDGRLWRTLPDLMLRPARLTRAYLDGHRAPQIPPLRLFLVVLLLIFLVGGLTGNGVMGRADHAKVAETRFRAGNTQLEAVAPDQLTPEQRAKMAERVRHAQMNFGAGAAGKAAAAWLKERIARTLVDPERFGLILEEWAERFAILMLPVAALLLSVLFVFQRRFYLFDHTIFSLHSLSAMGLLIVSAMLVGLVADDWASLLLLPAPVHLYAHMRGVYRTSVLGALARMALLFLGSSVAAMILVIGLVAVGLSGMGS